MISKRVYKLVMNLNKILVIYLLSGVGVFLLLLFLLNDDSRQYELICSVFATVFIGVFIIIGGVGLHFVHMCGCPFCGAGKHMIRDDKYDAELKKADKTGEFICPRCGKHIYIK